MPRGAETSTSQRHKTGLWSFPSRVLPGHDPSQGRGLQVSTSPGLQGSVLPKSRTPSGTPYAMQCSTGAFQLDLQAGCLWLICTTLKKEYQQCTPNSCCKLSGGQSLSTSSAGLQTDIWHMSQPSESRGSSRDDV